MNRKKLKNYPIEYKYKFKRYGATIPATSIEEAEEIMEAIKQTGEVVGHEIVAIIPANSLKPEWQARLYCFIKNILRLGN